MTYDVENLKVLVNKVYQCSKIDVFVIKHKKSNFFKKMTRKIFDVMSSKLIVHGL